MAQDPSNRQERRLAARQIAKEITNSEAKPPQHVKELLAAESPEILRRIPPEDQRKMSQLSVMTRTITRSGPLPDPDELQGYENTLSGAAERIMKMAENQQAHRIEMEKLVITSQQKQSARGQIFGLIVGLVGVLSGGALAYAGHDVVGGTIAGTTVVSLVYVFVTGKAKQKQDLAEKRPR